MSSLLTSTSGGKKVGPDLVQTLLTVVGTLLAGGGIRWLYVKEDRRKRGADADVGEATAATIVAKQALEHADFSMRRIKELEQEIRNLNSLLNEERNSRAKLERELSGVKIRMENVPGADRLRECEERFSGIFYISSIGFAIVSPDNTRILEVNESLCEILGLSIIDLLGKELRGFVHPDDLSAFLSVVSDISELKVMTSSSHKRFRCANGAYIEAITSISLVKTMGGSPKYFVFQIHKQ